MIEKDCDNWKFSSKRNEVIKAALNFFFLRKDFARAKCTKSTKRHKDTRVKAQKCKQANKGLFFSLDVF